MSKTHAIPPVPFSLAHNITSPRPLSTLVQVKFYRTKMNDEIYGERIIIDSENFNFDFYVDGKVKNTSNLEEFVEQSGKFQRGYSKRH